MSTRRPRIPARPVGVLGAAAILLLALGAAFPVRAAPTVLLVSGATGTDAGSCTSAPCATLGYALTQAASGDTIEIEGSVNASDSNTTGGAVVPASIRSLNIVGVSGPIPPQLMGGLLGMTLGSTLSVQAGQTVVISNLAILDGLAQFGGGINNQGNLTLDRVAVDSNVATPSTLLCTTSTTSCQGFGQGGGIYNDGTLTLSRSSVTENDAADYLVTAAGPGGLQLLLQGGGIYNAGSLLVYESSLAQNSASVNSSYPVPQSAAGGAIFNLSSTAEVIASTIFQNNAPAGSGIYQGGAIGVPQLGLGASLVVGNSGSGGPASECGWAPGAVPPTSLGYNAADSGAGSGCGLTQPTDGLASSSGIDDYLASGAYGLLTGQPEDYVIPFGTSLGGLLVCPALDQILQPRPLPGEASCSPGAVEPSSGFAQPTSPSPPTITSGAGTTFILGVAQSFQVTSGGSPAPAIFETGALPAGVTVSPHGLVSGTPAMGAAGTYPITLSAQNTVAPTATQQFALVVGRDPTGLTLGASPNPADAGHQLTFTATVTGAVQGVEPTGQVTISAQQQVVCTIVLSSGSGSCSGTLASAPATGTVTASATYPGDQSYQPAISSATVQYVGLPAVASASTLPPATYGTPYQLTLLATGGSPPYQWRLGAGAPPGLTLSGAQLAGTPTTPGTFKFQITARDAQGELSTQNETLTVNRQTTSATLLVTPSGSVAGRPVTLSSVVAVTGGATEAPGSVIFSVGSASLCSATVIGGSASCSTTRLPVGSGTATATYSGSADYATSTAEAAYLVVAPLGITTTTLPAGVLGQAYSFRLTAAGGTAPLSWKVAGGSLPPGLSLSPSGLISGIPSQAGEQPVTVAVSDASPEVPQQVATEFQVSVLSATSTPGSTPAGTGGGPGAYNGTAGDGGYQTPSPGAGGGGPGSGSAAASAGPSSAGAAALSWWDAVGVVVLALLAALGVLGRRRRRAC